MAAQKPTAAEPASDLLVAHGRGTRISGKKGERTFDIRTFVTSVKGSKIGRSIDTVAMPDQYV